MQAGEIGGEASRHCGFAGNPTPLPLQGATAARDVSVVRIRPMRREALARSARRILDRVATISIDARPLQTVRFGRRPIAEGGLGDGDTADVSIRPTPDDETLRRRGAAARVEADERPLRILKSAGRAADGCPPAHRKDVGRRAPVDLRAMRR